MSLIRIHVLLVRNLLVLLFYALHLIIKNKDKGIIQLKPSYTNCELTHLQFAAVGEL